MVISGWLGDPVMYASHILNLCIYRSMRSRVYHLMQLMVGGQDIDKEIRRCWSDAGECLPPHRKSKSGQISAFRRSCKTLELASSWQLPRKLQSTEKASLVLLAELTENMDLKFNSGAVPWKKSLDLAAGSR